MRGLSGAAPAPQESDRISLGRLLALFLWIGTIGFGGGMAVIALMERELVRKRRLIPLEDFLHGVGLGQILGSFAVNAAFFVGYRLYGAAAAMLSAAAFLLPSVALVTGLSYLYFRFHAIPALDAAVAGLGPVVIALILHAAWSIGRKVLRSRFAFAVALMALAAGIARINAVWVLLAAGAAGLMVPALRRARLRSVTPALVVPALIPASTLMSIGSTFLRIGLVFFGGGFVLIPVLHERLVTDLGWLTAREFIDGVAISNLTPGPIAILATFAGFHRAGIPGALAATGALMAPALMLMWILTGGYARAANNERVRRFLRGINPAVVGLVLSAAVLLGRDVERSWTGWLMTALAWLLIRKLRWHPAFVLAAGAAAVYLGALG